MNKFKNQLIALSLGLITLTAYSCGSETLVPDGPNGEDPALVNDPTRREVALQLDNKLNLVPAESATRALGQEPSTRADEPGIATAAENHITSLDIYVFGSDKEEGPYTFQERFAYREDGSSVPNSVKISLKANGEKAALATLRPKKGLFSKFYCVANQTRLLKGATVYDTFSALEQSSPGMGYNIVSKAGIPTEADFLTLTTPLIDTTPANADQPDNKLLTPLPMVGLYNPALDLREISMSSRMRINMTLSRIMARFDVVNNAALSHLTITDISMGNGRRGVTLFPVKVTTDEADPTKSLITYPDCTFRGDKANIGTQTGAFYSYPSPLEDKGYLIIKGKYALNQTDPPKDVSYAVEFEQQTAGTGGFIEVKHNHRYTLRITDADAFNLKVNITVSEWNDGPEFEYIPENEIKVTKAEPVTGGKTTVKDNKASIDLTDANNGFIVTATANSEIQANVLFPGFGAGVGNWIKAEIAKVPVTRSVSGAASDTYTCKVTVDPAYIGNAANVLFPKAVVLISSKAGRDEVSYEVSAVLTEPTVALSATTPASPTSNVYAAGVLDLFTVSKNKSKITLTTVAKGATQLEGVPTWITVEPATATTALNTETKDYTLTLEPGKNGFPVSFPANGAATFYVQNQSDPTKRVAVTVNVKESGVTGMTVDNTNNGASYEQVNKIATFNVEQATGSFQANFNATSTPTATITYATVGNEWLTTETITAGTAPAYSCMVKIKDGYTSGIYPEATVKFSFEGGVKEEVIHVKATGMLTPTVASKASSPTDFNTYTPGTETPIVTGSLAMKQPTDATPSTLTLTIAAKGGTKLVGLPAWLTPDVKENTASSTHDYVLTLNPAAAGYPTTFPSTTTFKVQNYSDTTKEVTIQVTLSKAP